MSFRLEIAFRRNCSVNRCHLENIIIKLANKYCCERYYKDFEYSGNKRIVKRDTIFMIFNFPEDSKYIINFLQSIKNIREIYIECIGFDNVKFTLLYASKLYLNMMDKHKAKEYNINKDFIHNNLNYKQIIQSIK
tara:strand:+ start:302 stop:706 length:405 start_codon:yes stop_codon:yes gene_type:complete